MNFQLSQHISQNSGSIIQLKLKNYNIYKINEKIQYFIDSNFADLGGSDNWFFSSFFRSKGQVLLVSNQEFIHSLQNVCKQQLVTIGFRNISWHILQMYSSVSLLVNPTNLFNSKPVIISNNFKPFLFKNVFKLKNNGV